MALSADGNAVAVGAYLAQGTNGQSGAVQVFVWSGAAWIQLMAGQAERASFLVTTWAIAWP